MKKKTPGKHWKFYIECMNLGMMPHDGLCTCANAKVISKRVLSKFHPTYEDLEQLYEEHYIIYRGESSYWAAGTKVKNTYNIVEREVGFTALRQTIVLFMACLNNEL